MPKLTTLFAIFFAFTAGFCDSSEAVANDGILDGQMAGYLIAPNEKVPAEFDSGFSVYVAAWPLLDRYPGQRFQTGLFGTWMFPVYDPPVPRPLKAGVYTDIEGGLGWWRDTRFATETPKFIMGGVDLNFRRWANGPGAGKGRQWDKPLGKYGVVQISRNVIWPPDGLNLKQGTKGDWFGYGYLPLPLTDKKATTDGKPVATGNRCWTLFLSTENFKGPVAYFSPYFWSQVLTEKPELEGKLLDAASVNPNRSLQMETQYIPAKLATSDDGTRYAKVAAVRYPSNADRQTNLVQQIRSYKASALWDSVDEWFDGGAPAKGTINADASVVHEFTGKGSATWKIHDYVVEKEERSLVDWNQIATPSGQRSQAFGYRWKKTVDGSDPMVGLPRFFKLVENKRGQKRWEPIAKSDVPTGTGLREIEFPKHERRNTEPYVTPEATDSPWKTPGPVAGPMTARPGDGSTVTYYWYRFADQPAMMNAGLTDEEREAVQARVEKLHRNWTTDRDYLPPPTSGKLAEIDGALIVTPPEGLEVGYVPIVTRQE